MMGRASGTMPPSGDPRSRPGGGSDLREVHNYAPWINVVGGLMVFVLRYGSPRGTPGVHWNLFLTGIVIMFAALATTIAHGNSSRNYWSTINVAAGAWLLVSVKMLPSIPLVTSAQFVLGVLTIVVALASSIAELSSQKKVQVPSR